MRWPAPLSSTNPLERVNKQIKCQADGIGIFLTSPPSDFSANSC